MNAVHKSADEYIGNKYRIIGQIQKWFPANIDLMADIFCGSCDVTFNTKANEHIANDLNFFVIEIYREFQETRLSRGSTRSSATEI